MSNPGKTLLDALGYSVTIHLGLHQVALLGELLPALLEGLPVGVEVDRTARTIRLYRTDQAERGVPYDG